MNMPSPPVPETGPPARLSTPHSPPFFAAFGANPKVKDAPRVLRPVGSVNSKAPGTVVHVAHREDTEDGTPLRYDMAALQAVVEAAVAPERPESEAPRAKATGGTRPSTARPQLASVPPKNAPIEAGRGVADVEPAGVRRHHPPRRVALVACDDSGGLAGRLRFPRRRADRAP